jgi:hypothetical protein
MSEPDTGLIAFHVCARDVGDILLSPLREFQSESVPVLTRGFTEFPVLELKKLRSWPHLARNLYDRAALTPP